MKLFIKTSIIAIACLSLSACLSGKVDYLKPKNVVPEKNSITINKPKGELWENLISKLGSKFFVINNLDKDSGLINISYSGDPENYIDCGSIYSKVTNARGTRTYTFPASRAYEKYEMVNNGFLLFIERKMSLEGRMNLIVQGIGPKKTMVTANTRYVVTKYYKILNLKSSQGETDTISFNSGQKGRFPDSPTTCYATGKFEHDVLSLISN